VQCVLIHNQSLVIENQLYDHEIHEANTAMGGLWTEKDPAKIAFRRL
jgi:hypothetical protein